MPVISVHTLQNLATRSGMEPNGLIRIKQDWNLTMHFQNGDKLINNIKATTTDTFSETTTTFNTHNTIYSEKFVHPNLARLIELGGA